MQQFQFLLGLHPDPDAGMYSTLSDFLSGGKKLAAAPVPSPSTGSLLVVSDMSYV